MKIIATPKEIQSGDVIHHQDQSIVSVSLSIKKIKNRTVLVLMPVDAFEFEFAIVFIV